MNRVFRLTGIGVLIFMVIWITSCEEKSEVFTSGTYRYVGYDLEGREVTKGDLAVTVENSLIEGEKNIQITATNMPVTWIILEAGEGPIEGSIKENGIVSIGLTQNKGPNMIIHGQFKNGVWRGQRFIDLLGESQAIGTFTAKGQVQ